MTAKQTYLNEDWFAKYSWLALPRGVDFKKDRITECWCTLYRKRNVKCINVVAMLKHLLFVVYCYYTVLKGKWIQFYYISSNFASFIDVGLQFYTLLYKYHKPAGEEMVWKKSGKSQ